MPWNITIHITLFSSITVDRRTEQIHHKNILFVILFEQKNKKNKRLNRVGIPLARFTNSKFEMSSLLALSVYIAGINKAKISAFDTAYVLHIYSLINNT